MTQNTAPTLWGIPIRVTDQTPEGIAVAQIHDLDSPQSTRIDDHTDGTPVGLVRLRREAIDELVEAARLRREEAGVISRIVEAVGELWVYPVQIVELESRPDFRELSATCKEHEIRFAVARGAIPDAYVGAVARTLVKGFRGVIPAPGREEICEFVATTFGQITGTVPRVDIEGGEFFEVVRVTSGGFMARVPVMLANLKARHVGQIVSAAVQLLIEHRVRERMRTRLHPRGPIDWREAGF